MLKLTKLIVLVATLFAVGCRAEFIDLRQDAALSACDAGDAGCADGGQ